MSTTTPINKYTEKIVQDDGTIKYKVYNKISPHYYMDKTGSLNPIDITNIQTITKDTVGVIKLREKNIVSAGLRTDGNKTKYLGLRPDETQEDGTQQLEWTIEEAIINNTTQSISLNQTSSIDGITTNLGGQVVQSTRFYTRQMVPVTGTISNFQIKYKLHLTGLQISNSKYTEDTIIRNNISGSGTITVGTNHYVPDTNGYFMIVDSSNNKQFQISLPVLLDLDLEEVLNENGLSTTHTLKDNGDGTYEYIKYPSDNSLINGISGSVRYIDATTIYGTAASDGYCATLNFSTINGNATVWNAVHDATVGILHSGTLTTQAVAISIAGSTTGWSLMYRSFLSFDTSGVSSASAGTLNVKGIHYHAANVIAIEGTQSPDSWAGSGTFNDFTGWESGWDGDAGDTEVVTYSDDVDWALTYNEMTLTAAALSHIGGEDDTQIVLIEYDSDYKDVLPTSDVKSGMIFTEYGDTTSDPYLEVTETVAAAAPPFLKILSGITKISGGRLVIK
jgi:hypothetical protein